MSREAARIYSVLDGVTVYEPQGFDPANHLPSPIFVRQPEPSFRSVPVKDSAPAPVFGTFFGLCTATLEVGDADIYGGGEVCGRLRRNNDRQFFWNTSNPACMVRKGKVMYQSQPFLLGVRPDGSSFGVIAETTWKSRVSIGRKIRFSSEGPAFRVILIEKDSPQEVVKMLASLTGKIELPPLWALGYQQCRYSYFPQEKVASVADSLRKRRIPCDVIWMDIDYMDSYKVFTFHPEGFRDPKGLNDYLHDRKFKAVYMIDPGVKAEQGYAVDDEGMAKDCFVRKAGGEVFTGKVWPGKCHFPDFTDPAVCSWWASLYRDFMSVGIDGVWNDMNEPTILTSLKGILPKSLVHRGGVDGTAPGPHLRYRNVYGHYMVKASLDGIKAANPDKRPFLLTRAAFLGTQRYAATWTGDNFSDYKPMKDSVPMVLNMGLSGQPFAGPDIGGFLSDCSPELLRHWTSSGIYFPFARNHASKETVGQEPWAFDEKTENVCRTAIERRYRLLPYYYTLFEEASRTGLPVMRPVYWADVRDMALRAEDQAFLIGDDLLVIPRWCQNPSLPKGPWASFSLEDKDDGYQAWLALRPGAVIPLARLFQNTCDYNTDSITFLVNPGPDGRAHGSLYEDAGDGYGYRDGQFGRYDLDAVVSDGIISLSMDRVEGNLDNDRRRIRLGIIGNDSIVYSDWTEGYSVSMKVPDENGERRGLKDFDFVRLNNFAVNGQVKLLDLIMNSILPDTCKDD
ncbi:MAG: DUF5110 domain-containing protein [Bacteroidales bacterium]|nr:DUF5110 domain-containing protein [Bacteroidales bacterium]